MEGVTPLIIATKNNYTQIGLFLLHHNVSIGPVHTAIGDIDPLRAVVKHDNLSLFIRFVERGTDIDNYLFKNSVQCTDIVSLDYASCQQNLQLAA